MFLLLAVLFAYLLGSIPTAVWVGRVVKGIDVREHGSGNAGATNTLRVLGPQTAIPVLAIDILKGLLATRVIYSNLIPMPKEIYGESLMEIQLLLGIVAVIGHIFPLFAQFRGGKGVATFFGVLIGIHPLSAVISLLIFVLLVALTKYVSLGSIIVSVVYPIQLIILFKFHDELIVLFSVLIPLFVILTHRKNIGRLIRGEESKLSLKKKIDHVS